ncbi:hypothetical protein Q5762_07105 [Streptomyces sp. P9(2023)]|uniref:hypothetical protein n=1 Tax=Streptomyces sp. P9(2023) TaxID=3064394 RepID=UPI0028F447E9|nr:hypothetical protein [Streptomyces sp. P9(2023)]MDT9688123.1 hypothetical protein [Streptomyces sp. P9(2023)]
MTATATPPREAVGPPRTSVLRAELRRGAGPWVGAAVAVTILVTMYGKAPDWQSRWTDATDTLHVATGLLAGPLALAAGCWQGGRERRRGTLELLRSVPRGRLRRTLLAVAPSALWPAAGQLLATAVCLLATWPYVGGGRPYLELVAADAVALAALGTLGHLVGLLVPWRLTAPLLAVAGYAGLGIGAYTESAARWLSPAAEHSSPWDEPVWWFAPASAVWTGGLALAALLAYAARPARLRLLALLPLAAAVAAAVPVLRLPDEGPWRPDHEASRPVCDSGTPQVCVPALDRGLLPDISRTLAPLNERLRGLPGAPVRWVGGPNGPGAGETELPDPSLDAVRGRLRNPDLYLNSAVQWLFSETCRSEDFAGPEVERLGEVHLAVSEWLAPTPEGYGVPVGPSTERHLDALRAKSPAAQRDYLARYLAADRCRPEEVPIP